MTECICSKNVALQFGVCLGLSVRRSVRANYFILGPLIQLKMTKLGRFFALLSLIKPSADLQLPVFSRGTALQFDTRYIWVCLFVRLFETIIIYLTPRLQPRMTKLAMYFAPYRVIKPSSDLLVHVFVAGTHWYQIYNV